MQNHCYRNCEPQRATTGSTGCTNCKAICTKARRLSVLCCACCCHQGPAACLQPCLLGYCVDVHARSKGRPGPVGTSARCHSLGSNKAAVHLCYAHLLQNVPTAQQMPGMLSPIQFLSANHTRGAGAGCTQSKWCELHKHPSATEATQKLRRSYRGQCTALILCQLTQTCFLGGPGFATWTFQGSSGSLSVGGGEVWKLFPLATAVCTWSSNSMTMKPPMSTAPNKLSGSFWSPPAVAFVYLMRV